MMEPSLHTGVQVIDEMSGTPKAHFASLMWAHGPMIYTLAVRLTGNTADGQDLAQETFVKAYKHQADFRGESSPGTWFYRICVNLWKNRVRYEKSRSFSSHVPIDAGPDDEHPGTEVASPEAPMGSELEGLDEQQAVQKALSLLSNEERALVVMRDMDDKSYEEISDLLGVPLGTVKSRLARTREKLRGILGPLIKRNT